MSYLSCGCCVRYSLDELSSDSDTSADSGVSADGCSCCGCAGGRGWWIGVMGWLGALSNLSGSSLGCSFGGTADVLSMVLFPPCERAGRAREIAQIKPCRTANATAWERLRSWNLDTRSWMEFLIVRSEYDIWRAISLVL